MAPMKDGTGRLGLGKNCNATAKSSSRGGRGRGLKRGLGRQNRHRGDK